MNSTVYYDSQYQYDNSFAPTGMAANNNNYLVAVDDSKIKLPSINTLLSTQQIVQQQQAQEHLAQEQQVHQVQQQIQEQPQPVQQIQFDQESMIPERPNGIIMNPSQSYYGFQDPNLSYTSPPIPATRTPDQCIPNKYPTPESTYSSSSYQPNLSVNPPPAVISNPVNPSTSPSSVNSFQQVSAPFYPSLPPPPPSSIQQPALPQGQQYYYPYHQATLPPHFPPTPPMGFSPNSMISSVQPIPSNPYQATPTPTASAAAAAGYFDPSKFGVQPMAAPQTAPGSASMIPIMTNGVSPMNPLFNGAMHHPSQPPHHLGMSIMAGRSVKPKRKRATPEQTNRLNEVFAETFFPTSNQRMDLAMELGMSARTVQIWFQNKRQGWRSEHRRPVPLNTDYLREQHEKNEQKGMVIPGSATGKGEESVFSSHNNNMPMPVNGTNIDGIDGTVKVTTNVLETSQPMSHYQDSFEN